jgi:hypothetical protein
VLLDALDLAHDLVPDLRIGPSVPAPGFAQHPARDRGLAAEVGYRGTPVQRMRNTVLDEVRDRLLSFRRL